VAGVIIEIRELTKKYGSFTAVDTLNLTIRKGEIFGLLGPNGAGKSTTILMMLGLTEPDSGEVLVSGINATSSPVEVKKKVGYLPEDIGFYDELTGLENLVYIARINRMPRRIAAEESVQMMERVGLSREADKKAGKYSRGMRQRLGLAEVLIKNPEVIILDEPTLGIDPSGVRDFLDLIVKLSREDGLTVLFSSHHLQQVQQVCDRVGLFVGGKLLADGDIHTLSQKMHTSSPFVIEAGITVPRKKSSDSQGRGDTTEWLAGLLRDIEGVGNIRRKEKIYSIECSTDRTADIAAAIISSGARLNYLNKKEYGLDEIYYQYFEGNVNHG
jgi:ABC-2 type transport system ATP-binding protein